MSCRYAHQLEALHFGAAAIPVPGLPEKSSAAVGHQMLNPFLDTSKYCPVSTLEASRETVAT